MKITALALSILTLFSSMPVFSLELPDADKEYFIAAGDVVNINVLPAEEFSKEVTVNAEKVDQRNLRIIAIVQETGVGRVLGVGSARVSN